MRTGVIRPRRSEARPMAGAVNASIAAAVKNAAPTADAGRAELVDAQRDQHVEGAGEHRGQ